MRMPAITISTQYFNEDPIKGTNGNKSKRFGLENKKQSQLISQNLLGDIILLKHPVCVLSSTAWEGVHNSFQYCCRGKFSLVYLRYQSNFCEQFFIPGLVSQLEDTSSECLAFVYHSESLIWPTTLLNLKLPTIEEVAVSKTSNFLVS